jgi:hypothetical protein
MPNRKSQKGAILRIPEESPPFLISSARESPRATFWPFLADRSDMERHRLRHSSKNAKIGDRQRDMAMKFYQAGLLSRKGMNAVQ